MASKSEPITAAPVSKWPDEKTGPWEVRTSWAWLAGRLECIGVALWHGASWTSAGLSPLGSYEAFGDGPQPVLASDVRGIPLAGIVQQHREKIRGELTSSLVAHQHLRAVGESFATAPTYKEEPNEVADGIRYEELLAQAIKSLGESRPGIGRPRMLGPEELARVAEVYLAAWGRGEPPTKAVAEQFGISTSAAAKRVAAARRAGVLSPTSSGRPSGVPELDDSEVRRQPKRGSRSRRQSG